MEVVLLRGIGESPKKLTISLRTGEPPLFGGSPD